MKRTPPPRKSVDSLQGYQESPRAPLDLSDNVPPFDPNPAFAEALATFAPERAREYPSFDAERFREAAARVHGVKSAQVLTTNGSNDLLDLAIRVFAEPGDKVAWHPPSFEMIGVFARAAGCAVQAVPLRPPRYDLDADGLIAARAKVTVLCRPNNPTGNAFPREDVERVVKESDGLVVVDEAYADFLGDSFANAVGKYPNLLVVRTLSKAQGLASLRIGYGLAQEPILSALAKVRGPFRLNALSEHIGVRALERSDYSRKVVEETRRERARVELELRTRGFQVVASDANFLLFKPPEAAKVHAALLMRGIALRKFSSPELAGWLRVTVGPAWVTQRFLAELDDSLRELGPRR